MHHKNYKNATNEISNNEKKWFFGIFRLGKPRVIIQNWESIPREILHRLYIFENFFNVKISQK